MGVLCAGALTSRGTGERLRSAHMVGGLCFFRGTEPTRQPPPAPGVPLRDATLNEKMAGALRAAILRLEYKLQLASSRASSAAS